MKYPEYSFNYWENYLNEPYNIIMRVFIDLNKNVIQDSIEVGTNLTQVVTSPDNSYAYTAGDGKFYLNFDEYLLGSYEIFPQDIEYWSVVSDSAVYHLYATEDGIVVSDTLSFGISLDTLINKLDVQLAGGFSRCNSELNYWISIKNEGTNVPTGIIIIELDDSITFVSLYPVNDSIT